MGGFNGTGRAPCFQVPPDELAVVTAGDQRLPCEADASDIAGVAGEFLGLRVILRNIQIVDLGIGAAEEQPAGARQPRHREQNVSAGGIPVSTQGKTTGATSPSAPAPATAA